MLALTIQINMNWWLIPSILTVAGAITSHVMFKNDNSGFAAGAGALLFTLAVIIPTVMLSWIIALVIAYINK